MLIRLVYQIVLKQPQRCCLGSLVQWACAEEPSQPCTALAPLLLLLLVLLTGEKPITYDREWRMHMPNPNLLRVPVGTGPDAIPRTLVDLVSDCGAYSPDQRPSMREVSSLWGSCYRVSACASCLRSFVSSLAFLLCT